MYNNNIVNFKESTTILNACKKSLETYRTPLDFTNNCVFVTEKQMKYTM